MLTRFSLSVFRSRALACLAAGTLGLFAAVAPAHADGRPFSFLYDASVEAPGEVEYEQWVTWQTQTDNDKGFDRFDFRHEIEFGVTDKLQLAIYAADWSIEDSAERRNHHTRYEDSAIEATYQFFNPIVDDFGLAGQLEFKGGPEVLEVETRLIVQKNIDKLILAYNAVAEFEWEGKDYEQRNLKLEQSAGISYEVHQRFNIGAELVHQVEYEGYAHFSPHALYVGPNFAYRGHNWWFTLTPLFQATNVNDAPNFQTRLIVAFEF